MERIMILIFLFASLLTACSTPQEASITMVSTETAEEVVIEATEIVGNTIKGVVLEESADFNLYDIILVNAIEHNLTKEDSGSLVKVTYDGIIEETYLPTINAISVNKATENDVE